MGGASCAGRGTVERKLASIVNSFLDQFSPALVATLIGGAILLVAGYIGIERRLQKKAWRDVLGMVHDELQTVAADIERFLEMLQADNVPYARLGAHGWELLLQGRVLEGVKPKTSAALRSVYDDIRTTNGKLERLSDMRLGTMAVVMATTTAAATRRRGRLRPAVRKLEDEYNDLVLELNQNLCVRLPVLRKDVDRAIRAVEVELKLRRDDIVLEPQYGPTQEIEHHDYSRDHSARPLPPDAGEAPQ